MPFKSFTDISRSGWGFKEYVPAQVTNDVLIAGSLIRIADSLEQIVGMLNPIILADTIGQVESKLPYLREQHAKKANNVFIDRKWQELFAREFRKNSLHKAIAKIIKQKFDGKLKFQYIASGSPAMVRAVMSTTGTIKDLWLAGCRYTDPDTIPAIVTNGIEAVKEFDPFTFPWSPDTLPGKTVDLMRATGLFVFAEDES